MKRKASAQWSGDLKNGLGKITTDGVINNAEYSFVSRFEDGIGTNPEELLGTAHAACFSMELANKLSLDGYSVDRIHTTDSVHLEKKENGFAISKIVVTCEAAVQGINKEEFLKYAENAKNNCIVSKALSGVKMELITTLR
ncbi:MAG: OsmC family peroxiredoxin [Bacteroidota bacterium]|nr:OsmC family peroxiredoxin [Bacteroidota bacterium]